MFDRNSIGGGGNSIGDLGREATLPPASGDTTMKELSLSMSHTLRVALALLLSGCPGDTVMTTGTFFGEANGVFLAVVGADDLVTAYACDGNYDYLGVHAWFYGKLDGGAGTLTSLDGAELILDVDGDRFTAELSGEQVTLGPHKFNGAAVTDGQTGLYWGAADGWIGGWIVDSTGEQRGAAIRRETDDVSLAFIDPTQSSVVLDDQVDMPVLPLARMTTPEKVE